MASNSSDRIGFLSAGGVLSVVAGIFQIISGVSMAVNFLVPSISGFMLVDLLFLPFLPLAWQQFILCSGDPDFILHSFNADPISWVIIGGCVVLGIIAVAGGVSAVRRKRFGLSLAGAICALLSGILGILAVIFVSLGRREFGAED